MRLSFRFHIISVLDFVQLHSITVGIWFHRQRGGAAGGRAATGLRAARQEARLRGALLGVTRVLQQQHHALLIRGGVCGGKRGVKTRAARAVRAQGEADTRACGLSLRARWRPSTRVLPGASRRTQGISTLMSRPATCAEG